MSGQAGCRRLLARSSEAAQVVGATEETQTRSINDPSKESLDKNRCVGCLGKFGAFGAVCEARGHVRFEVRLEGSNEVWSEAVDGLSS